MAGFATAGSAMSAKPSTSSAVCLSIGHSIRREMPDRHSRHVVRAL
jgi:hypothetical protein